MSISKLSKGENELIKESLFLRKERILDEFEGIIVNYPNRLHKEEYEDFIIKITSLGNKYISLSSIENKI